MIFLEEPSDFNPKGEGAGCFLECQNKILVLRRSKEKDWARDKWGLPAGGVEKGETPLSGVIREVFEEAGVTIEQPDFLYKLFVRFSDADLIFHVFKKKIESFPKVFLSHEHSEYDWIEKDKLLLKREELTPEFDSIIKLVYEL